MDEAPCELYWYHLVLLAVVLALFTGIGMLSVLRR